MVARERISWLCFYMLCNLDGLLWLELLEDSISCFYPFLLPSGSLVICLVLFPHFEGKSGAPTTTLRRGCSWCWIGRHIVRVGGTKDKRLVGIAGYLHAG